MANLVPAGSDVSAGTYKCTNCGYQLEASSTQHLPPCPSCGSGEYETVSGGAMRALSSAEHSNTRTCSSRRRRRRRSAGSAPPRHSS
jgi:predicted  nucleic acid-binding Zn-ribbon protein